ncbi:MAG: cysteine--tRNA ligase [Thermodesulfobacteriota bacterium]
MGLRIHNSLTRKKEDFEPIRPGKVGMYVCGVTVYDMCHIGHARSVVLFDVIYRYLKARGYEVIYVRNFTDVDDKIINRANQLGEDWDKLAERFIGEFYTDMDALGVARPDIEPKATQHVTQILGLIEKLIENGHAYQAGGDVMYSVDSFRGYGKLSGKKTDELVAGARVDVDEKKRNPLDFALWKAAKPGEPFWESPWGAGRPGWHIECSAMSMEYLGESFDIHGGGADLAFPHHENEIAQSEGASGGPFVKYWIHNGFVNIRSEKMSKSLGNVLNIRDILTQVHHESLRLFLLSSHYRSPLDYNDASIKEASVGLERLYAGMSTLDELIGIQGTAKQVPAELVGIHERFVEAMDDDFNTPKGLAILFEAARAVNRIATAGGLKKKAVPRPDLLSAARKEMEDVAAHVLGILTEDPKEFLDARRKARLKDLGMSESELDALIAARTTARNDKDFARADEIRAQLSAKGIELKDSRDGTTWNVRIADTE